MTMIIVTFVKYRTLTAYAVWQAVKPFLGYLPASVRLLRDQLLELIYDVKPRGQWEYCVSRTDQAFPLVTGTLFVNASFTARAKDTVKILYIEWEILARLFKPLFYKPTLESLSNYTNYCAAILPCITAIGLQVIVFNCSLYFKTLQTSYRLLEKHLLLYALVEKITQRACQIQHHVYDYKELPHYCSINR